MHREAGQVRTRESYPQNKTYKIYHLVVNVTEQFSTLHTPTSTLNPSFQPLFSIPPPQPPPRRHHLPRFVPLHKAGTAVDFDRLRACLAPWRRALVPGLTNVGLGSEMETGTGTDVGAEGEAQAAAGAAGAAGGAVAGRAGTEAGSPGSADPLIRLLDPFGDQSSILVCNFNNVDKMEPVSFSAWMELLRMDTRVVLVMLEQNKHIHEQVSTNLRAEAASHGVHPGRLQFAPRRSKEEHVARTTGCDLFVDNFVYGAHTTASDVTWASVPLVTLRGIGSPGSIYARMPARVGASLLEGAGLGFLAAHTVKEFTKVAQTIIRNGALRAGIRRRLAGTIAAAPMFNTQGITRNTEAVYQAIYEHSHAYTPTHAIEGARPLKRHHVVVTSTYLRGWDAEGQLVLGNRADDNVDQCEHKAAMNLVESLQSGHPRAVAHSLAVSERLLSTFPGNPDGWQIRGLAYYQNGTRSGLASDYKEGVRLVKTALRSLPVADKSAMFMWRNLAEVSQGSSVGWAGGY